jgi:hypothetical protein
VDADTARGAESLNPCDVIAGSDVAFGTTRLWCVVHTLINLALKAVTADMDYILYYLG